MNPTKYILASLMYSADGFQTIVYYIFIIESLASDAILLMAPSNQQILHVSIRYNRRYTGMILQQK